MAPSRQTSLLITVALASALTSLYAQTPVWQSTEGPYHGTANCFVKGPHNYLYAGTEVGVFRTPIDHDAWELVSNGILDRAVVTLTTDSAGVLYAGTTEGAFRSFDEGGHWEIVNFGLGNMNVHALLAGPHGVVLAATDRGIYRSVDRAASWMKAAVDSVDTAALCFAVHPSGLIFAGSVFGLMESTDDGAHWTYVRTNLGTKRYSRMVINGSGLIAVLGSERETLGWFGVSRDTGHTFMISGGGFSDVEQPSSIALDETGRLFVGTSRHSFDYPGYGYLWRFRIVDIPGNPFQPLDHISSIAGEWRSIFISGNLVFASGADLVCSRDTGLSYQSFMRGLTATRVLSLADNGKETIFAGTQYALHYRPDTASTWSSRLLLYGDYLKPILCMTSNGSGLLLAGSQWVNNLRTGSLWYSSDFGASWQESWWEYLTSSVTVNSYGVWFGTDYRRLWRGSNSGFPSEILDAGSDLISVANGDSTELYTGSVDGMVYCSYDTGTTWTSTRLVPAGGVQCLVALGGGRLYAGTSEGFFASSDRGSSWVQRGGGEVPSNIRVLVTKAGVGTVAGTPDGVFRSTDEGEHWESLNEGLAVKEIYSLCFGADGSLYAGTSGGGVFRLALETILSVQLTSFSVTQAAGGSVQLHWVTASEMDNNGFEVERRLTGQADFATVPNSFRPGHATNAETHEYTVVDTTPGIGQWQYRLKQMDAGGAVHYTEALSVQVTTDVKNDAQLPRAYGLSQNYPNPFNPKTGIRYQVSGLSDVRITVYDMLGREVAVLVNERKRPGSYEVPFEGSDLASGVYIYRMTAGPFVASRKMMLMK